MSMLDKMLMIMKVILSTEAMAIKMATMRQATVLKSTLHFLLFLTTAFSMSLLVMLWMG